MAFNVAKIASARASLTISLTKSLRVAGPFFLGPVTFKITFEIYWPPGPVALEAYYGGLV